MKAHLSFCPHFLRDYKNQLDCCFLTFSHQSCEVVGFIFHIKGYYSFVSFFKSTSTPRMCEFSVSFSLFQPESKSFPNPDMMEMTVQTKDNKENVPSSTPERSISLLSFLHLFLFLPFVYLAFIMLTRCVRSAKSNGIT